MSKIPNKPFQKKYNGGYIMILNVLLFISIVTVILISVSNIVLARYTSAQGYLSSKQSYFAAHSATEEAVYRILNNKHPEQLTNSSMNISSSTVTIATTNTASGKRVTVNSTARGYQRNLQVDLKTGTGVAFHYGIQAGNGGFILNGGSKVIGNVYSNADIVATNGVDITGSAFAADGTALTADQMNDTPTTPTNSITFRNASGAQDLAQGFRLSTSSPMNKIAFYIKKYGNPADITVRIVGDTAGSPNTTNAFSTNGVLQSAQVSSANYGWVEVVFPENPILNPNTTYWVVLDSSSQNANNYYIMGANNTYLNGIAKIGAYNGTWNNTSPSGLDAYMRIYLGGITSTIGGSTYVGGVNIGSSGVGDAWANEVIGAKVAGNLYCKIGSYNNKPCDTSRPNPAPQPMPVSDANITDWKNEAEAASTTIGNVTIGWQGGTLDSQKITGNLTVNGGGTLTVNGTLWVQGTFTVTSGGKVKLNPAYGANSGVIVVDGIVSISGGGSLSGSGTTGSYIMVLTTSDCPASPSCNGNNAVSLSGGAGAVILNAQKGTMTIDGGSGVREASANKIITSGGATITYDSGLANTEFASGPGGGYDIQDWLEI